METVLYIIGTLIVWNFLFSLLICMVLVRIETKINHTGETIELTEMRYHYLLDRLNEMKPKQKVPDWLKPFDRGS
jgi:hypothetical protein